MENFEIHEGCGAHGQPGAQGLEEQDPGPLPHDDRQQQEQRGQQVSWSLDQSVSMYTLT